MTGLASNREKEGERERKCNKQHIQSVKLFAATLLMYGQNEERSAENRLFAQIIRARAYVCVSSRKKYLTESDKLSFMYLFRIESSMQLLLKEYLREIPGEIRTTIVDWYRSHTHDTVHRIECDESVRVERIAFI